MSMQRGQAEAVFGEGRLAAQVAAIHGAELADGDVALVDEDEGVVGEIFEQGRRRLAGFAAGEVARIVLDAGAGAGGFHHLEIEQGALLEALGFEEAAGAVELLQARGELGLDGLDGAGSWWRAASRSGSWRRRGRRGGRRISCR